MYSRDMFISENFCGGEVFTKNGFLLKSGAAMGILMEMYNKFSRFLGLHHGCGLDVPITRHI